MKLKYYIRTLGLGIFVTALLMGFATTPKSKEDVNLDGSSEVLSNQVLSEVASTTEDSRETQENTEEVNENKDQPESELKNETGNESESESEESKDEMISEAVNQPESESASESENQSTSTEVTESFASLEIRRGDSSDKVSRKLQELGLIKDAKSFDRYLCDKGYDKRISVGSYSIPRNSSEEEIALIISGKIK